MHKPFVLTIFLLFVCCQAFCQKKAATSKKADSSIVKVNSTEFITFNCRRVETEAKFGEGDAWDKYLQQNVNTFIPKMGGAPVGTYTVVVQFMINKEGVIEKCKAISDCGYGMEDEVVRIIQRSPKWIPATQNGRIVNAYKRQSFTFTVSELMITRITKHPLSHERFQTHISQLT